MTANVALLRSEHDKALATEQRRTAAIEATYRRRIDELQVRSRAVDWTREAPCALRYSRMLRSTLIR